MTGAARDYRGACLGDVKVPRSMFPDGCFDPAAYVLEVEGTCLSPRICHGDLVLVSPTAPLLPGGYVALWPRDGRGGLIKRLVVDPGVRPEDHVPGGTVVPIVVVEMLNPERRFAVAIDKLASLHRVLGVLPKVEDRP